MVLICGAVVSGVPGQKAGTPFFDAEFGEKELGMDIRSGWMRLSEIRRKYRRESNEAQSREFLIY